ncbi:MAG: hypothetical protein ACYTDY_04985 [Planctomycetota bacterium]
MRGTISHLYSEETVEAKARWFRSLPIEERMAILCEFTELALTLRPDLAEKRDAPSAEGRVLVLEQP